MGWTLRSVSGPKQRQRTKWNPHTWVCLARFRASVSWGLGFRLEALLRNLGWDHTHKSKSELEALNRRLSDIDSNERSFLEKS